MRRLPALTAVLFLSCSTVAACAVQQTPARPAASSLPPATGVGGGSEDYQDISAAIQRGIQAADEQDVRKYFDSHCARLHPEYADEHLDQEFAKDVYRGIHVVSISDIRVTGERAEAKVVIKDAESEFAMDVHLVREQGHWLVC